MNTLKLYLNIMNEIDDFEENPQKLSGCIDMCIDMPNTFIYIIPLFNYIKISVCNYNDIKKSNTNRVVYEYTANSSNIQNNPVFVIEGYNEYKEEIKYVLMYFVAETTEFVFLLWYYICKVQ